mgnify:CR=1 FL=1
MVFIASLFILWRRIRNLYYSYPVNDEIVRLTRAGWEYIEANDRPLLHRWAHNITENFPTFVVSVIFAVFSGWVLFVLNNS